MTTEQVVQTGAASSEGAIPPAVTIPPEPSAEEQMAKNLGIPLDKYLKQRIQILKEKGSVS